MIEMDNPLIPANAHKQRCPRCQSPLNTVVIHGHEQCAVCKSNIFECCSGDTCETDHNLAVGYKRGWDKEQKLLRKDQKRQQRDTTTASRRWHAFLRISVKTNHVRSSLVSS